MIIMYWRMQMNTRRKARWRTRWVYRYVHIMTLHFIHGALGRLFSACSIWFKLSATALSDIKSFTDAAKKLGNGNAVVMAGSQKRYQITPRLFKLLPESAVSRAGFSKPVQWLWASWSLPIFAFSKMGPQRQDTALSVTNVFSRKNIFILKKTQWTLLTIYRNILT